MTGIHNRSASLLDKLVFPDPGRPVTIMHLGLLLILAEAYPLLSGDFLFMGIVRRFDQFERFGCQPLFD